MEDIEVGCKHWPAGGDQGFEKSKFIKPSYGESSDDSDDDLQTEVGARVDEIEVQKVRVRGTRRGLITLWEEIR